MNDRIKELAEQAGYKHPDAVGECEDYAYFDHEKFAELIVQECALVANIHNEDAEGVDLGVGRVIKEHFGVD